VAVKASQSEKLRYRVDNFLGQGSRGLFMALVAAFLVSVLAVSMLRWVVLGVEASYGLPEGASYLSKAMFGVWVSWLQITDPGNMAQDNDTYSLYKIPAIMGGMTGVVIFSALIAFLTTALDQAIEDLKKGHSRVLENNHTLIVGWGPRALEILRELVEANESEDDPVVVILADEEKEVMDEWLLENWKDRRNTRLVTRSGGSASLAAVAKVSAECARSAIILAHCSDSAPREDQLVSDAKVIKTALALCAHVGEDHKINIVAEVFDNRNRMVVKEISPERISVVDATEILAKVMVQTSRTSGLSVVYAELLSFEGCEMYFYKAAWGGISFGDLAFRFEDGVPLGVRHGDGSLSMRPAMEYTMDDSDDIVIVAQDDSAIDFGSSAVMVPKELPAHASRQAAETERLLILGWSPKAAIIISEFDEYVLEGSEVHVMMAAPPEWLVGKVAALSAGMEQASVSVIEKDPLDAESLGSVNPLDYDVIIVLPQRPEDEMDAERIDSETIIVLLHLRKLMKEARADGLTVSTRLITEVVDSGNRELISRAGVNDFIISNRMVSMMFAQISEEPDIQDVYDDLFQEDGSEIYVKPAWLYFDADQLPITCSFGDLMAHARKRDGEICLGIKVKANEQQSSENYGVSLIPPKDTVFTLQADDGLVVLAEDDT